MCSNRKSHFWWVLWLEEISGNKRLLWEVGPRALWLKGLPWWLVANGHSQRTKVMTSRMEGNRIRQNIEGTQDYFTKPTEWLFFFFFKLSNSPEEKPLAAKSSGCRAEHHANCPACSRSPDSVGRSNTQYCRRHPVTPRLFYLVGLKMTEEQT